MKKKTRTVPEGFQTVSPYLVIPDADQFIEFTKKAFDAEQTFEHRDEQNYISHATIRIGNSIVMIGDTMNEMQPMTAMLYLYVDDADAMYNKAVKAGGQSIQAPKDEFYGDRTSAVKDRWGNQWWIATHIEDVAPDELERRGKAARKQKQEEMAH
jgi:uncharacterized glyoxalase superfamily protein PhnB